MPFVVAGGGGVMTGQTIVIKGEISGNEDLTIAGRVEGEINLAGRVLTLAPGSHVTGHVAAGTVVASGEFDGSISASARLEIRSTAVVSGDLNTPSLFVADGAEVNATVKMPLAQVKAVA
jgi:cytoskeletal protein CcmA (bactofilin family)